MREPPATLSLACTLFASASHVLSCMCTCARGTAGVPTDLAQPSGEKVVLREIATMHSEATSAYIVWPLAARRLLGSLPLRLPLSQCLEHHLQQVSVRALQPQPRLATAALDEYTPGLPVVRYRVVFKPRVAVRTSPSANAAIDRAIEQGAVLDAVELSADRNWVRIGPKQWLMVNHPEHGALLERIAREGEADDDEDEPW
jgi:hypothetical protein